MAAYAHDVTYTTIGTKPSVDFDPKMAPFEASVAVIMTTGPVSYGMQYTLDDFTDPLKTDANAVWIDSTGIPLATVGSAQASLNFPVSRIRLVIATLTAGNLRLQTQQGYGTI